MNRRLVRRLGGLAGVATLAAGAVLVPLTDSSTAQAEEGPPPDVSERRVLTNEHVDAINVGLDGQQLTVNSKISPPVEYLDVDELVFQLSDLGYVESLPAQYVEFIGADDVWIIPQSQNAEVIWAGWSTEDIGSGALDGDSVDITLADVQGPGDVEVWQTVGFGEIRRIFSSDEDYKTLSQSVNAHVHASWAFTEPGVYTLTFVASATIGGQALESDPIEYTWVIGGDSGALPEPAPSTTALQAPSSAEPGEQVSLTASVSTDPGADAPPEPGGYVEFRDGDESLGWTGIVEGEATLPVLFEDAGEHVITATYVPQEPQFYAGSDAEPTTVVVDDAGEPVETILTIDGLADHYHSGAAITLTAVQEPEIGLDHYHWFGKRPGDDEFVEVGGGATFETEASSELDGAQYYVELYGEDHEVVATSEPVTIVVDDHEDPPGTESGGDESGGDESGGDASGDDSGGDASGADDGTDAGGDDSGGDESGGDESGGDESGGDEPGTDTGADDGTDAGNVAGADTGDESGGDASGGADGTDNGAGPKPTTKPTNGVCPPGKVPAGSQPSASPSDDGSAKGNADGNGQNGDEGQGDGSENGGENGGPGETPSGEQVVLTNEHVDLLSPRLNGSDLSLEAKVGSANDHTFYDPGEVLVNVKPAAESTVPDGAGYGFLGDAGDPIWLIPETQNPEIVWAGWSTEELSAGDFQGDTVDMRMVDVQGPGTLEVFQTTGFGDVSRIFSSIDSLDARRQSVGQHVHANWAFSAEGEYTVTFEVTGSLAGGESVSTGPVEYTFTVGEQSGTNQASSSGASAVISPALHTGSGPSTVSAATQTLPDTGAADAEDCVLASTGTSAVSGTVVIGGVLVLLGGVAALYAYRRRGVSLT